MEDECVVFNHSLLFLHFSYWNVPQLHVLLKKDIISIYSVILYFKKKKNLWIEVNRNYVKLQAVALK